MPACKEQKNSTLFKPGQSGNPAGRKPGTPNKFTSLKQAFLNVFQRMGGEDELLAFAKTHKPTFYGYVVRLFPQEVAHSGEIKTNDPLIIKVVHVKSGDPGNGNGNGDKAKGK